MCKKIVLIWEQTVIWSLFTLPRFQIYEEHFQRGRFYTGWVWFRCQITLYRCGHLPPKLWKFNKGKFYIILVWSEKFNCSICPRNLPFVRVFPNLNMNLFHQLSPNRRIVVQYVRESQLNCILVFPNSFLWWFSDGGGTVQKFQEFCAAYNFFCSI